MRTGQASERWNDLLEELKQLEAYFPNRGVEADRDEIGEEIQDLEELIAAAGEPEDEHSLRALTFLQTELVRKRATLDGL